MFLSISRAGQIPRLPAAIHSFRSAAFLPRSAVSKSHHVSRPALTSRSLSTEAPASFREETIRQFKESISAPQQTDFTKLQVPTESLGKEMTIWGYIGTIKSVSRTRWFTSLTDLHGRYLQIHDDDPTSETREKLSKIRKNSSVAVTGILGLQKAFEESTADLRQRETVPLRYCELWLKDITLLNEFSKDIIIGAGPANFPPSQRHLQFRFEKDLAHRIRVRSKVAQLFREALKDWHEIETPILFKSTPEGAREFLVPTRTRGLAYALPQSPQQYKQVLMASGIGQYYQFARCFRDEDLRADRQPEFTQLDMEMPFAGRWQVMKKVKKMIQHVLENIHPTDLPKKFGFIGGRLGYEKWADWSQMTYQEAMATYGSDKPDYIRVMKFQRVEDILTPGLMSMLTTLPDPIFETFYVPLVQDPQETRKFVKAFAESPAGKQFNNNPHGAPGIFVYDSSKPLSGLAAFGHEGAEKMTELFGDRLKDGMLIIVQARPRQRFQGEGSTSLGRLRLAVWEAARAAGMTWGGYHGRNALLDFIWVNDFPLFTPDNATDPGQGGTAGFTSTHHPFTAPKEPEDVDLLFTDPLAVTGDHYDLVLNGMEIGGGSRRIHNAEMQKLVMRDVLKMSEERIADFDHLFEALKAGCPPHAGFALGFDRFMAILLGRDSIRDVIAFPKSSKGEDMMAKSPSVMTDEQLKTYHLQLTGGRARSS